MEDVGRKVTKLLLLKTRVTRKKTKKKRKKGRRIIIGMSGFGKVVFKIDASNPRVMHPVYITSNHCLIRCN